MAPIHDPPDPRPRALPAWVRAAFRVAAALVGLVALAGAALETPWGVHRAAQLALGIANPWPGTELEARGAAGGVLSGIQLHGLTLRSGQGDALASLDTLRVEYRLLELLGRRPRIRQLRASGLALDVTSWPPSRPPPENVKLAVDRIDVRRATCKWRTSPLGRDSLWWAEDAEVRGRDLRLEGERVSGVLDTLVVTLGPRAAPRQSFRLAARGHLTRDGLHGLDVRLDGDSTHFAVEGSLGPPGPDHAFAGTDLRLALAPLAARDIRRYVPSAIEPADLVLDARLRRDGAVLVARAAARSGPSGRMDLDARATPSLAGPVELRVRASTTAIDVGPWIGRAPGEWVVEGTVDVDLSGPARSRFSGPVEIALDGSRVAGHRLERARFGARFDQGRATLRAEASSEGFILGITGSAEPFGEPPNCELRQTLTIPPLGRGGAAPTRDEPALVAGELMAELSLRGRTLADAVGTLGLALRPQASPAPLVGAGRLDATLGRGVARWRGGLDLAGGRLSGAGEITPGRQTAYAIREGVVNGIDLAALLGDTTSSRLDARFHLEGRDFTPASARASVRIAPLALRYGPHRLEADSVAIGLRDGRARLVAAARLDGAGLLGRAGVEPLDGRPRKADLSLAFDHLDLARVTGDTALASDLTGRVEGSGRGPDLAAAAAALAHERAVPPGTQGSLSLTLAPSRWRGRNVSRLELSARLAGSELALAGRLESEFGRARLTGSARPFSAAPSVRIEPLVVEDVDLGSLLGVPTFSTRLGGNLSVGATRGDSGLAACEVGVKLDGSTIRDVRFDRLALEGRLVDGRLEGRIDAHSPNDSIAARFEGRMPGRGPVDQPPWIALRGRARVAELGALIMRDSLDAGADLEFDLRVAGQPKAGLAALTASGRVQGAARFARAQVDTVRTEFNLGHGLLDVTRLELRGGVADVSGAGRIALPHVDARDSTAFRLTGTLRDLQPLAPLLGARSFTAAGGRFSLSASGPPAATGLTGDLVATRIVQDHSRADSLALMFRGTLRDTTLTMLDAQVQLFSLIGGVFPPRDLDARGRWDGHELAVEARADVDETRWQELAFRFAPGATRSRLTIERLRIVRGQSRLEFQRPTDISFGQGFEIGDLVILQNGTPSVTLKGGIDPAGHVDLRATIDSVEVRDYFDVLGVSGLRGRLSGGATVTGMRERPVLDGWWRANLLAAKRRADLDGKIHWAEEEVQGEAAFVQRADQLLSFTFDLPVALTLAPRPGESAVAVKDRPLSWTLEARRFDLAWFGPLVSPRVARDLRGGLGGRIEAQGSPSYPSYKGEFALTGARVQLPSLGTRYDTNRIGLALSGRTIAIEPAVVRSGSGRLQMSGHATFEGPGRRTFKLETRADRLHVLQTPAAVLLVSGTLEASGQLIAPRVEGSLELVNSTFYVEGGVGERQVESVELSQRDWRHLETRYSEPVALEVQGPSPLDSLDADVGVKIGSGVWVRRRSDPILALELGGQVRVLRRPGDRLNVSGRVDIRAGRSYVSFLGRRLDMTRANIELPGPISGAKAELEARYRSEASQGASAPDVTALVTVDSAGARIDLSSVPYMDHASLITYLTTGQTQGEVASEAAAGLAVGSVLGAVGGAAGRSLGFQVVQVNQDAYGGQILSAGNYVDPRIYLGFRQPVVQGRNTTSGTKGGTYSTEFEVEVEVARRLLFNLQGGGSQYRFLFRPRLGE